ncbi:sirohydrochlorin chelatase [Agromyces sp. LHK192]|uniref:sirohydrochlorin chelatase n=1 Tax=Agromyces sp. LHK192 TaxID=2498704 RepID=UPI001F0B9CC5|nr:CbiX/SirB N-terminal domain-containing protein [Agromyces sp. LHK192]
MAVDSSSSQVTVEADSYEFRPLRLVAVTHGVPSPANREAIMHLVDGVVRARPEADVSITFVDAQHSDLATSLAEAVSDPRAIIVPLVLSAGYHVRTGLARGLERLPVAGASLADPLGPDERIVEVLERRLGPIDDDDDVCVVLAAAGSNDPRAVRECFETARLLGARIGRAVTVGFIAAAIPRLPDAIEMLRAVHPGTKVHVATYLLAPGTFYDAAIVAGADVIADPLLLPGEAADDALVRLVLDRADAIAEEQEYLARG